MKTALNKTHCSSSQALDEMSKTLRTIALMLDTATAARINQLAALPVTRLILSIILLSLMSPPMISSVASVERRVGSSRHHHAKKPRPTHACHVART